MPSTPSTAAFLANHQGFMRNHVIAVPEQLASGNRRYSLSDVNDHLRLLTFSTNEADIQAYLVNPMANNKNKHVLPAVNGIYMLTSEMNGCQFIAYGHDRHAVTVEHNNFIDDPAQYAGRLNKIAGENHPYLFHIHENPVNHDVPNHEYRAALGIQIVGQYRAAVGWQFFVRDNLVQPEGALYGPF